MSGFSTARQKMVDGQVRPSDVTDSRILDAMLAVPREAFVPPDQQALAYLDLDLDVSGGAAPKRYLIKPVVTAKMLQAAEIKATDKVLVVGCATGYAAAIVANLAGRSRRPRAIRRSPRRQGMFWPSLAGQMSRCRRRRPPRATPPARPMM